MRRVQCTDIYKTKVGVQSGCTPCAITSTYPKIWVCKKIRMRRILDDVWAILDLDSIGIPFGVDHKACRILVTTKNECVCSTMGAQTRKIPLNVLSEGDSWALFRRISGEVVDSPRFNAVARDVVEECGGFPLMLVKIGRSLRGKTLEEWKYLCRQLKKSRALNKKKRWTKTLCLMSIIDFILKLRFLLFFYILSACTCLIEFNIMLYPLPKKNPL